MEKLDSVEVMGKYQIEISKRFPALESLDDSLDINKAWESIRDNIKTSVKENLGYHKLKHSKPWFNDECSELMDTRKQTKLRLRKPSQINVDNL